LISVVVVVVIVVIGGGAAPAAAVHMVRSLGNVQWPRWWWRYRDSGRAQSTVKQDFVFGQRVLVVVAVDHSRRQLLPVRLSNGGGVQFVLTLVHNVIGGHHFPCDFNKIFRWKFKTKHVVVLVQ